MAKNIKSTKRKSGNSAITMKCRECKRDVKNVDIDSFSVLCYRCTSRSLNPNTMFVDELSKEEWNRIREKLQNIIAYKNKEYNGRKK